MRYFVFQNTNTESTQIAEFDDMIYAKAFINAITKGLTPVDERDTDPREIWYEVTDSSTINNDGLEPDDADYDPCGKIVYSGKHYYFE